MDANFWASGFQGWPSAVWAVAAVIIAVLFFRYLASTATLRFQAAEARALREKESEALRREDRLRSEERSAAINAERRKFEREDEVRDAAAEEARLATLHTEAKADVAGNAAAAGECKQILAEADAFLLQICRYYTVCEESIDPDDDEPDDPLVNLGDMQAKIKESYDAALEYFDLAQKMVTEGLYLVAKRQAEGCLLEAKYCHDRIVNLDTNQWTRIQASTR